MVPYTESVRILDADAQETFNQLVENSDLEEVVSMLNELGVPTDALNGAVYGWAKNKAGLY